MVFIIEKLLFKSQLNLHYVDASLKRGVPQ